MRKISGDVVSTNAMTLSRAAHIVSRFAAVDNGSSPAVALYVQRTADAFNRLVQFHDKRSKLQKLESSPKLQTNVAENTLDGESSPNLEEKRSDGNESKDLGNKVRKKDKDSSGETNLKGDEGKDLGNKVRKKGKKSSNNLKGDEAQDVEISVKKKKKKRTKSDLDNDVKEKKSKKKKSKVDS